MDADMTPLQKMLGARSVKHRASPELTRRNSLPARNILAEAVKMDLDLNANTLDDGELSGTGADEPGHDTPPRSDANGDDDLDSARARRAKSLTPDSAKYGQMAKNGAKKLASAAKKVLSAVSFSRSSKKFRKGVVAPELYESMSGRGVHEGNASAHASAKFASQPAADNYNKGLLAAVQAGDRAAIGDRVRDLTNGSAVTRSFSGATVPPGLSSWRGYGVLDKGAGTYTNRGGTTSCVDILKPCERSTIKPIRTTMVRNVAREIEVQPMHLGPYEIFSPSGRRSMGVRRTSEQLDAGLSAVERVRVATDAVATRVKADRKRWRLFQSVNPTTPGWMSGMSARRGNTTVCTNVVQVQPRK